MLNTQTARTAEMRLSASCAVEQHLRRHGKSLCDLLDALDDPRGLDALCDLKNAFGQKVLDADAVEGSLRNIHRVLADQAPSPLDQIGHALGLPASEMNLWHGARISEILARFGHAD
ncbi:hypothetical protein [Pseudooceanicola sp. LIPI14-2-Ac024]|uniref:hypothetical protein n=1 Tax=Pseudooceanicola sp. LIPI14-2-Ac024 TaxID=3344875 RepID=UPI0035CEAF9F